MRKSVVLVGILLLTLIAGCSKEADRNTDLPEDPHDEVHLSNGVPKDLSIALREADVYQLVALSGSPTSPGEKDFHGWHEIGRVNVSDQPTRMKLTYALEAGALENRDRIALCFQPEHGIHIVRRKQMFDLVICFHCLQVEVTDEHGHTDGFPVSSTPMAVFDDVLKNKGFVQQMGQN